MRATARLTWGFAVWGGLLGVLLSTSAAHATFGPFAFTDGGIVVGEWTPTMKAFRGIPYAAPPVGELRWKPPQRASRWFGLRDATQFANHCPQPDSPFGTASVTEDCLYLNVYVPKRRNRFLSFLRPVMVWIHGGALYLGQSDDYDPTQLVKQGVIVVTINYRLGSLGYLSHPALSAEAPYGGSGNYGIMDQQAALEWVQRNIRFFGGDPNRVTIFGQSAGGLSVHANLASPQAAGLFDRAIVQSGAYALDQPSLADAEAAGQGFATAVGCDDQSAECLRAVSVEDVLANQPATPTAFTLNVDNHVLTQPIRSALASGEFNQVPVMEGTTHDEWRLFVALLELQAGGPPSPPLYPILIRVTLGVSPEVASFIANTIYPLADYPSVSLAYGAVSTDAIFACNGRRSVQLLSQHVRTYAYEFNDQDVPAALLPPVSFDPGAFHASELTYLFDQDPPPVLTEEQAELADDMVRYWTQFARFGNPNSFPTPLWRRYDPDVDEFQSLDPAGTGPIAGFAADHKCDFWTPEP